MGCYAEVNGDVKFSRALTDEEYSKVEELLKYNFENLDMCDTDASFSDYGSHWEDDFKELLDELAAMAPIECADAFYHGECDTHDHFLFENGEWQIFGGGIVYEDEKPPLSADYLSAAIIKWVDAQAKWLETAAIYNALTEEFGFSNHDLALMDLDWILDTVGEKDEESTEE